MFEPPDLTGEKPLLPEGKRKHDEFFGDVETYRGRVAVRIPLAAASAGSPLTLKAASQGCADAGVCYPPTIQQVRLTVPRTGAGGTSAPVAGTPAVLLPPSAGGVVPAGGSSARIIGVLEAQDATLGD